MLSVLYKYTIFYLFLNIFFKRFYLFIFRQSRKEGERKGEKHQCVVASHMPPTGDLAHNPGMCPNWELNWWPFGSQSSVQYTEQHQPGLISYLLHYIFTVAFLCLDMFRYTNTYLCVIIAYSTCGKHQAMAESGPPPCFIQPGTLFLPRGSAELSLNS